MSCNSFKIDLYRNKQKGTLSFCLWFLGAVGGRPYFATALLLCLFSSTAIGQSLTVIGKGEKPLAAVAGIYLLAETQKIAYSNDQGILDLEGIQEGSSLELYRFGYESQRIVWSSTLKIFQLKPKEFDLEEVVITAQYQPTPVSESIHAVRSITADDIEKRAAVNLNDVLRNELNFRVGQDNILGTRLAMQGISGENVKIMIDGVPVIGRLDGNIDLTQLNLNTIERIEIVEGPLAVNYGSNALAGTINLITKSSKTNQTDIGAELFTESTGHYNVLGTISQGWNKNTLSISAGRNYFDGWSPTDDPIFHSPEPIADSRRAQQWNPREQIFADAKYRIRMDKGYFEISGSYFDEVITNRGTPMGAYGETAFDDSYQTYRYGGSAKLQLRLTEKWNTHHVLGYNIFRREKSTFITDLTGVESLLTTNSALLDTTTFSNLLARGSFIGKINAALDLQLGYEAEIETSEGKRIFDDTGQIENIAAFITAEWKPLDQLTIKPGIRAAYNSRYDAPLIPSLSALYKLPKFMEMRASYAQGFRAPGLKELSFFFVDINHNIVGNADLDAERSHNFSASIHSRVSASRKISWSVNGFYNQIYNLITLSQINTETFSYINVGERRTTGGRGKVEYTWKKLSIAAGFAVVGVSNNLENEDAAAFVFTPEAIGRTSYTFQKLGVSGNVFFKHYGRQTFLREDAEGKVVEDFLSAYQNLDLTFSKVFAEKLTVEIGARNLTDVQNINSTVAGGVHGGGGQVAIGTGRTVFARLRFNISKLK